MSAPGGKYAVENFTVGDRDLGREIGADDMNVRRIVIARIHCELDLAKAFDCRHREPVPRAVVQKLHDVNQRVPKLHLPNAGGKFPNVRFVKTRERSHAAEAA